jgi:hypothetical protein
MENEIKSMENENNDVVLKRKAYVKPTVVKHAAATQVVGSAGGCNSYSATGCLVANQYYY